jgi:hypothetical protein
MLLTGGMNAAKGTVDGVSADALSVMAAHNVVNAAVPAMETSRTVQSVSANRCVGAGNRTEARAGAEIPTAGMVALIVMGVVSSRAVAPALAAMIEGVIHVAMAVKIVDMAMSILNANIGARKTAALVS